MKCQSSLRSFREDESRTVIGNLEETLLPFDSIFGTYFQLEGRHTHTHPYAHTNTHLHSATDISTGGDLSLRTSLNIPHGLTNQQSSPGHSHWAAGPRCLPGVHIHSSPHGRTERGRLVLLPAPSLWVKSPVSRGAMTVTMVSPSFPKTKCIAL